MSNISYTIEQLRAVADLCSNGYELWDTSSDGGILLNEKSPASTHIIHIDKNGDVEDVHLDPVEPFHQ